jgi:hypothetical protein
MTLCPASGTNAWGNGRPIRTLDPQFEPLGYKTGQCFNCLGRFRLVWRQGRLIPKQVLDDHEPERKP